MKSHGRDIYHTTLRYARNAFTGKKQNGGTMNDRV